LNILDIFFIALGLSADAFAVAIGLGLTVSNSKIKHALIVGVYFGLFQAVMPVIGYLAANQFAGPINAFGHWVAFAVLVIIGGKMIWGSFRNESGDLVKSGLLKFSQMIPLALATSIDALVIGASFAFLEVNVLPAAGFIGIITFVLSAFGFKLGSTLGAKWQSKANLAGGIILVLLGVRVLFV